MSLPVLKWAGGKRFLADRVIAEFPQNYGTYFEPFAGGAALFFKLAPHRAVISDVNEELINFYLQLRDQPQELFSLFTSFPKNESDYYRIRSWRPCGDLERASRFFYLTSLSFNGLYRVNLKGEFNVPYGQRASRSNVDISDFKVASATLQRTDIKCADFEVSVREAGFGDIAYFDPPYTLSHNNNGFVKYNEKIFSWEDQLRLAKTAKLLVDRGCRVVVSNAAHSSVIALYEGFRFEAIDRRSVIASKAVNRKPVTEYLFIGGDER